jgi:hypothetical protein
MQSVPSTTNVVSSNPAQARWTRKVCQWLAIGRWFSPGSPVSSTNTTARHDITEILLNVSLSSIHLILNLYHGVFNFFSLGIYIYYTFVCHSQTFWKCRHVFLCGTLNWLRCLMSLSTIFQFYRGNQCISPPTFWVQIPVQRGVLDTTLCDKVRKWRAAGRCSCFMHQ